MSGEPGESVSLSGYARYRARNSVSMDSMETVWGPVWGQSGASLGPPVESKTEHSSRGVPQKLKTCSSMEREAQLSLYSLGTCKRVSEILVESGSMQESVR